MSKIAASGVADNYIRNNEPNADGVDRRGFLKCMAWAGTGALCIVKGGVLSSYALGGASKMHPAEMKGELIFVQLSDSHMGFNKAANPDVAATFQVAIDRINALPTPPAFILHTGDISHLSKPAEFDTVDQMLKGAAAKDVFFVPGEHDVLTDNGRDYLDRYGKASQGGGWYSFEKNGVHFIGLVNVMNLKAGGLGTLGPEQLEWLQKDVKRLKSSTPIVVFAHIPLWAVYPEWGWGTDDSAQALSYLKRFGSVTVLNGHIHQTMQKVEGNITFHTACSTAFPQPAPGQAPSPGPMKVEAGQLRGLLGMTTVSYVQGKHSLAVVDSSLERPYQVNIGNFSFSPATLTVPAGARVTWTNKDDVPHTIVSTNNAFPNSPALDTEESFSHAFAKAGAYDYFCSVHPKMVGKVVVQ